MKTITHPDTYVCEKCETEYEYKELAELCETFMPLPPIEDLNVKVGDTILCESRYDGWFELEVIDIKVIASTLYSETLKSKDPTIKRLYKKGKVKEQELTDLEHAVLKKWQPHKYVCVTDASLTVCNDKTCSDEWRVDNNLVVNPQWNPNFESCPDDHFFIKYVHGEDTVIRRGNKKWFIDHWQDKVQFVGWISIKRGLENGDNDKTRV